VAIVANLQTHRAEAQIPYPLTRVLFHGRAPSCSLGRRSFNQPGRLLRKMLPGENGGVNHPCKKSAVKKRMASDI